MFKCYVGLSTCTVITKLDWVRVFKEPNKQSLVTEKRRNALNMGGGGGGDFIKIISEILNCQSQTASSMQSMYIID